VDRDLHLSPETVHLLFPLKVEDDVLMDSRGFIVAEFCCESWKQTAIADAANEASTLQAHARENERLRKERDKCRNALANMMGAYDTPLSRRRFPPDEFREECLKSGREALAEVSGNAALSQTEDKA
jgi:hypothetical protein